jgi:hypothetical protein
MADTRLVLGVRVLASWPSISTSTRKLREGGKQARRNPRELGISELVGRVTRRVIVSIAMECRIRNHDGGPSLFFVTGEIARSTLPGTSLIIAMMPVMAISRAVLIRPMAMVPRPRVDTEYPVHPADRHRPRCRR